MSIDTATAFGPSRLFADTVPVPVQGGGWLAPGCTFISPIIDGFAAPGTMTTVIPAIGTGYRVIITAARLIVISISGTLTGNPAGKAGNNAGHDNLSPTLNAIPSAANLTAAVAGDFCGMGLAALTGKTSIFGGPEMDSPVIYEQTAAATGAATLTFRIQLFGSLYGL